MTATQKYEAFCNVVLQVRAIEARHKENQRIQAKARAAVAARVAVLEKQREDARKYGAGFSLLK